MSNNTSLLHSHGNGLQHRQNVRHGGTAGTQVLLASSIACSALFQTALYCRRHCRHTQPVTAVALTRQCAQHQPLHCADATMPAAPPSHLTCCCRHFMRTEPKHSTCAYSATCPAAVLPLCWWNSACSAASLHQCCSRHFSCISQPSALTQHAQQ